MTKTKAWISAMRLRTLPLSFSNVLLGTALALMAKDSSDISGSFTQKNWIIFGLTLLTTLFLQVLSNFANDYGDTKKGADNENRIGPERAVQSGLITTAAMLKGIIITSVLSFVSGIILLYFAFGDKLSPIFFTFLVLGILAIAAAIKYTVGKGAYGYSGLGDLFVFIFFGLVGVLGTFYLQVQSFHFVLILPAITMGCFSVAVLNLNNMRDQINDKAVGKNTLVVKLGFYKSKTYHVLLFTIAYLVFPIPFIISGIYYPALYVFIIPILIIHLIHVRKVLKIENPKDFDPELKKIALSAFLFSLLFFITVLFHA